MSYSFLHHNASRSASDDCARLTRLGYTSGKHMELYGEHVEFVSDPFENGDCVAVRVISTNNPDVRTIDLPVSILAGLEDSIFDNPESQRSSDPR